MTMSTNPQEHETPQLGGGPRALYPFTPDAPGTGWDAPLAQSGCVVERSLTASPFLLLITRHDDEVSFRLEVSCGCLYIASLRLRTVAKPDAVVPVDTRPQLREDIIAKARTTVAALVHRSFHASNFEQQAFLTWWSHRHEWQWDAQIVAAVDPWIAGA